MGAAADVWSAGEILYESLLGRPPFQQTSTADLIDAIRAGRFQSIESIASHVPPAVAAVISRCLWVSPTERYANAGVLQFALLEARERAGLGSSHASGGSFIVAAVILAALALFGTDSILVPIATGQWDYVGGVVMDGTLSPAFRSAGVVLLAAAAVCAVPALHRARAPARRHDSGREWV